MKDLLAVGRGPICRPRRKRLREDNKEFTQKLKDARQKMTNDERTKYDNFMRIITDRNSSKDERADALYGADILLKPYGVSIGFAA